MWTDAVEWIRVIFGGDALQGSGAPGQIMARCALIYAVGVIVVRLGKSRLLSRATPLDVILAFCLGSLLSRGINGSGSLSETAVAAATLVAIHWGLTALAFRFHWVGAAVKGRCYQLISHGEILWKNLKHSHISEHDLVEWLRINANIDDPSRVRAAYKERSGEVGVVVEPAQPRIIDVAVREGVQLVRIEFHGMGGK